MRVLVTGGFGCIGSWIAKNLIERGEPIWVYDLKDDRRRMCQVMDEEQVAKIHFVPGDITDLSAVKSALEQNHITHVIHLAGLQVPVCRADPILGARVNVLGTLTVFEAVAASEPQARRIVYASSAAVFGSQSAYRPGPLADDVPLKPTTHYGVFKCCNEADARIYYQDLGISSIGLRPWTVYGVGRDFGMTSEPTKAIKSIAVGWPYHISYGGLQDLQFADDVAKTFLRCLEAPFEGAAAYNLRGSVVDMPEFHRHLCQVAPEAARLITHGHTQLPIAYDLSDEALQRDLGPMPATALEEGILQTLERFRQLIHEGRLDLSDLPK